MSKQLFKIVNRGKGKGCRLLGVEGVFTSAGGKNPGELSNLCRLVLKANDTTGDKPRNLTANIPMADFPSILEAAKLAYKDSLSSKKMKFSILEAQAKPKVSDKTDEGTLIYKVGIEYDASRLYPVTITITNFRANVTETSDGTLRYTDASKEQPYISVFTSAREFLNKVTHVQNMYSAWATGAEINGEFNATPSAE